ncbi:MAG: hypothetical protein N3F66_08420 [Spirochaetes bacterium]|nr:hypothetical protein [Spirochaetota bacterium]
MRITNDIQVVKTSFHLPEKRGSIQTQQPAQGVHAYPSLQKAISAYTIISEAHQLVTMAINISYELIQKAFSPQTDHSEIVSKIAAINNYFTRLSPGTVSVANIPQSETLQQTSKLIDQLNNAVVKKDINAIKTLQDDLFKQSQILENSQQQLYTTIHRNLYKGNIDIDSVKKAIEQNHDTALYAHKPLQYEHIKQLLA